MPDLSPQQFQEQRLFDPGESQQTDFYDTYGEEMANYAAGGVVQVNIPSSKMQHVLDDEEILNQYHTGTSQGTYMPDFRSEWEEGVGLNAPVYGSVQIPGGVSRLHPHDERQYGEVGLQLNRSVRPRTTITHGDSLGRAHYVTPLDDAARGASVEATIDPESLVDNPTRLGSFEYVEAQIEPQHGRLGIGLDEVRAAEIPLREQNIPQLGYRPNTIGEHRAQQAEDTKRSVAGQLEDRGIPTYVTRQEQIYQPPLPYRRSELIEQGFKGADDIYSRASSDPHSSESENLRWTNKRYRYPELPDRGQ